MNNKEFIKYRYRLKKTKQEMAKLLGISESSINSYEKGYRSVPIHVELQMVFFLSRIVKNRKNRKPCWIIKKCPPEIREKCPTWEFKEENFCWLVNGTICCGNACKDLAEKMKFCRSCEVLKSFL
jgi:DNA-binding XRE family transcriptional regulator